MKQSFECLILLLKGISILRDIWDQSWRNFMLIKTTYPNFLHGSDFSLFLAYELIMSLRKANEIWPFLDSTSLSFPTADQGNDDSGNEIAIFQASLRIFKKVYS